MRQVTIVLLSDEDPEIVAFEVAAIEDALMGHDESIWTSFVSETREAE